VLFSARLEGRVRRLVVLPPVFMLWANLHNAFVIGLVACAIFVIEAWLARDPTRRALTIALVASAVASQINPSGIGAVGRAVVYAGTPGGFIVEEGALDILSGPGLVFAVLLLAAFTAALIRGREGVASRLGAPLLWPGLITPFALLALAIQRDTPYACMVLAPFVAAMVPDAMGRVRVSETLRVPGIAGAGVITLLAVALGATAALAAPSEPDLSGYPTAALAALGGMSGNVLNEYDWGGYLIRFAPEHRTFIDGRGALLFTRDVLEDFERAVALGPGYRDVLARRDIAAVLLRPDRPLVAALREDGWRVVASDTTFVLLAKR